MNIRFLKYALATALSAGVVCAHAGAVPETEAPEAAMKADNAFSPAVRQALQQAVDKAGKALEEAKLPSGAALSLLPLAGDSNGMVEGLLKIAVTKAGLTYVEGRADPVFTEILKEVEWDERKADMLDAATIDKFGRLKSTQILLYGFVRVTETKNCILAEIELHATSIATKEHLCGGSFAQRDIIAPDAVGFSKMPADVRRVLRDRLSARIAESLNAQTRLDAVKTVAIVPLAGDMDSYVTWLVRDAMLKGTQLSPREFGLTTRGDAVIALRDKPQQADAYLYGAVRELSSYKASSTRYADKFNVVAEIQVSIEKPDSLDVLWSDTFAVKSEYSVMKDAVFGGASAGQAAGESPRPFDQASMDAISAAAEQAGVSIRSADAAFPKDIQISLLPLEGDIGGAVAGRMKIAVTDAGRNYVELREDPVFEKLVDEISWDEAEGSILDKKTIDRFGSLQASRVLIYGSVQTNAADGVVEARLNLHATEVKTRKHVWGGVFSGRSAAATPVAGATDIPDEIRSLIRKQLGDKIAASLKSQPKLWDVKCVALVPLASDRDNYLTYVVRDAFGALPGIATADAGATREAVYAALKAKPELADAILYGAVRQLADTTEESGKYTVRHAVKAEVQLCIEDAATRKQLWSGSFSAENTYTKAKPRD